MVNTEKEKSLKIDKEIKDSLRNIPIAELEEFNKSFNTQLDEESIALALKAKERKREFWRKKKAQEDYINAWLTKVEKKIKERDKEIERLLSERKTPITKEIAEEMIGNLKANRYGFKRT